MEDLSKEIIDRIFGEADAVPEQQQSTTPPASPADMQKAIDALKTLVGEKVKAVLADNKIRDSIVENLWATMNKNGDRVVDPQEMKDFETLLHNNYRNATDPISEMTTQLIIMALPTAVAFGNEQKKKEAEAQAKTVTPPAATIPQPQAVQASVA